MSVNRSTISERLSAAGSAPNAAGRSRSPRSGLRCRLIRFARLVVFVYFGFLLVLYAIQARLDFLRSQYAGTTGRSGASARGRRVGRARDAARASAWLRCLVPPSRRLARLMLTPSIARP